MVIIAAYHARIAIMVSNIWTSSARAMCHVPSVTTLNIFSAGDKVKILWRPEMTLKVVPMCQRIDYVPHHHRQRRCRISHPCANVTTPLRVKFSGDHVSHGSEKQAYLACLALLLLKTTWNIWERRRLWNILDAHRCHPRDGPSICIWRHPW